MRGPKSNAIAAQKKKLITDCKMEEDLLGGGGGKTNLKEFSMTSDFISSLNIEALALFMTKLETMDDKESFCRVCKDFLRAGCFTLKRLTNSLPNMLFLMLPCSPKLLIFECSETLQMCHLELLARSCPNLQWLDLERSNDAPDELDFDDEGLSKMARCTDLVGVELSNRLKIGDVGITEVVRSAKNLAHLCLQGCVNVGDESLRAIGDLRRLSYLDVTSCPLITDEGLAYLGIGEVKNSLEQLILSDCGTNITASGMGSLSKITGLKMLDLSRLANVTDESLVDISSHCTRLETLHLNGCEAITGKVLPKFVNLRSLQLVNCPLISLDDVKAVARILKKITSLVLDSRMSNPPKEPGSKYHTLFGVRERPRDAIELTWI